MAKVKDLIGQKFGRLKVIKKADYYISPKGQKQTQWLCECDCGKKIIVRTTNLKSGNSKSCGCLQEEKRRISKNKKYPQLIYDKSTKRLLNIYRSMINRCYNKNTNRYIDWGGRGIKVCDDWRYEFINFYNWAIKNGYQDNLSIDRIDNNGNYEPDNCRWTTNKVQARNSSKNHFIVYNNKKLCIAEWAEITGLTARTILLRLRRKWSIEKALTTKPMINQYKFRSSNEA